VSRPSFVRVGAAVPHRPTISVCILMTGNSAMAADCVDALRRSVLPTDTEILVVANGTPSDQIEALDRFDDIVMIRSRANLGFAGGNNLAAAVARGNMLVFINDDSMVEPGCIDVLVRAARADPTIGAVGSRISSVDGVLQEAGALVWADGAAVHIGAGTAGDGDVHGPLRDVDYVSANGLLVLRSVWDIVGGFDERFFPAYYEDVDLCFAVRAAGYRVVYQSDARLRHLESQSTSDRFRLFLLERNRRILVEKRSVELAVHERRPLVEGGRLFDRSIDRAITRAQRAAIDGRGAQDAESERPGGPRRRFSVELTEEAQRDRELRSQEAEADVRTEYIAELERQVVPRQQRIRELEKYVASLLSVRMKKVIRQLVRRSGSRRADGDPSGTDPAVKPFEDRS
jgi:GT2 family glycosyltransferase